MRSNIIRPFSYLKGSHSTVLVLCSVSTWLLSVLCSLLTHWSQCLVSFFQHLLMADSFSLFMTAQMLPYPKSILWPFYPPHSHPVLPSSWLLSCEMILFICLSVDYFYLIKSNIWGKTGKVYGIVTYYMYYCMMYSVDHILHICICIFMYMYVT